MKKMMTERESNNVNILPMQDALLHIQKVPKYNDDGRLIRCGGYGYDWAYEALSKACNLKILEVTGSILRLHSDSKSANLQRMTIYWQGEHKFLGTHKAMFNHCSMAVKFFVPRFNALGFDIAWICAVTVHAA